jgi:hypothetical protein
MSIWNNIWDDAAIDRTDEIEWEPIEIDEDDEDEDLDLDLDLDEVVSLDEWMADAI